MFNSTFSSSRSSGGLAGAYRQVDVETSIANASPHKLVQMMFDGFIESIAQARGAMRTKSIPDKARAVNRALGILEDGLHAGLNMEAGGQLAANLSALYTYVAMRLTHANLHNDEAALDECSRLIQPLQEAWVAIGPQVNTPRH